jgi:hypothetical protein|tara:strand:- start:607 stop:1062 length:456 start_codon:yes stop_codon:yes gene_type:complete
MTDRGIPTELKTGFNLLEPEDPTENIASIVLVFMENAVKSADIYVKHAKRNSITAEDIKRGLMLEVFFTKQRPNMLEQCEKMKETLKKILDEDDSDEELEIYEEVEDEEFKESKCKCPMCGCMNTIYTRWEGFTPETTIEKAMFNHINNIN